jgi:hypothetical protein
MSDYLNTTGKISVTQCFSPFISWDHISPEVLQKAAARGQRVHDAIADELNGEFAIIDDDIRGYMDGARRFLENVEAVSLVEERLVSDVYGFTGQIDLLCRVKGDEFNTLVDFKTSSIVSKSWPLQVAAYRHLVEANNYGKVGRSLIVQLKKDGTFKIHETTNTKHHFSIFLNVLSSYKWFNPGKMIDIDFESI